MYYYVCSTKKYSIFPCNSEAPASELQGNMEEMFSGIRYIKYRSWNHFNEQCFYSVLCKIINGDVQPFTHDTTTTSCNDITNILLCLKHKLAFVPIYPHWLV